MYQKITKYRTADGKEHETAQKAAEHIETQIIDAFRAALMPEQTAGNLSMAENYKIAEILYKSRESIRAAISMEYYGNDEADDE